jgi:hypothetical protein
MARCKATTKNGRVCKNKRQEDSLYCTTHAGVADPEASDHQTPGSDGDDILDTVVEMDAPVAEARIMELEEKLAQVSLENQRLKSVVETQSQLLAQAQTSLLNNSDRNDTARSSRKITAKRIENKARSLYYHDHKDNATIKQHIKEAMKAGNLLLEHTKESRSQEVVVDNVPWQFKKTMTNAAYEQLSDADKDMYMTKARLMLEAQQH